MDPRQVNQQPMINNQQAPSAEQNATHLSLRSVSTFIMCPSCQNLGVTRTDPQFNVVTALLAFFCGACWGIYQSCNAKEYNCYDTTHYCQRCGNLVGKYVAC